MRLPLTQSSLLRAGTVCVVGMALCAGLAPPSAHAQSRRARGAASGPTAKIQVLQARHRKAIAIDNGAVNTVNRQAIFLVAGKIERGDTSRLLVYGRTYGQNEAANNSLGQTSDETFLTLHHPDPNAIRYGRYEGCCVALSQTEFARHPPTTSRRWRR